MPPEAPGALDRGASAPLPGPAPALARGGWRGLRNRLAASPRIQSLAARLPLLARRARREGEALFDIVAGFVHAQVLVALVELDLLAALRDAPERPELLARRTGLPLQRMEALLRAGIALGLLERVGGGVQASARGAAVLGVPGLADMIRHHGAFYRDMADPVALLRGEVETELSRFWPYVFGAAAVEAPEVARRYSRLMAESQAMVAEDTLATVSLRGVHHLMDVGGGTGAFLIAVGRARPGLRLTLFDLPEVLAEAPARLAAAGLGGRVATVGGSFRDGPLPGGADAISLVRVLYDHDDATVAQLLARVHAALPPGGLVLVSEPMSGGARPARPGDVYFAFYTMAMGTGRTRSQAEIAGLLAAAGFTDIRCPAPRRAFVTSVVTARKPG